MTPSCSGLCSQALLFLLNRFLTYFTIKKNISTVKKSFGFEFIKAIEFGWCIVKIDHKMQKKSCQIALFSSKVLLCDKIALSRTRRGLSSTDAKWSELYCKVKISTRLGVCTCNSLPVRQIVSCSDVLQAHLVANVHGDIQEFKLQDYTQYGLIRTKYQTTKKLRTINTISVSL